VKLVGAMNNDMMGWSNDQRLDNTIRTRTRHPRSPARGGVGLFEAHHYDALYYKSTDAAAFYDAYGDIVGGSGRTPSRQSALPSAPRRARDHQSRAGHRDDEGEHRDAHLPRLESVAAERAHGELSGGGADVTWTPAVEKDVTEYVVSYGPRVTRCGRRSR
jgi:hypothetical protein